MTTTAATFTVDSATVLLEFDVPGTTGGFEDFLAIHVISGEAGVMIPVHREELPPEQAQAFVEALQGTEISTEISRKWRADQVHTRAFGAAVHGAIRAGIERLTPEAEQAN